MLADHALEVEVAATLSNITPCLWYDGCGEEAAKLYVSLFPN
jgi:predicted 3-demethylubiquinone-9 3-methyltransferase (glyoxalase superfamily)